MHPPAPQAHLVAPPAALKLALVFMLVAVTVLTRFGVRLNDVFAIGPGLVGLYLLAGALVWTGRAQIDPAAALVYVLLVAFTGMAVLVNLNFAQWRTQVSVNSWALLVVLYAPFVLRLAPSGDDRAMWLWLMHWYLLLAAGIALLGVLQYFIQFAYRAPWIIDFTPYIPEGLRSSGMANTANAMGKAFKSNGFFLREPSSFSFYMAFALVLEWSLFRRLWLMALLAMGLVVSYSGSGIAILLAAMTVPLGFKTLLRAAAGGLALVALYFTLGDVLNLDYTVGRVNEFTSNRSSAYCRFIAPAKTSIEQIDAHAWVSLLGHGSGTMQKITNTCETTYGKVLFEYGLIGTLLFAVFMVLALRRAWMPLRARVGLGVYWLLLGGHLLAPEALLTILALCAIWPQDPQGADPLPRMRQARAPSRRIHA